MLKGIKMLFQKQESQELILYGYQDDCLSGLREGFKRHKRQMLYLSTGGGKSEIAIKIADLASKKGTKTAIISDRRVLVNQLSERFDRWTVDHNVQMAGHWRSGCHNIQLCSAQTLEACGTMPDFDMLIIDEAHRLRKSIKEFIKRNPHIKVIGLSASPFTKGLGSVFSNVVCKITHKQLVDLGQLVPVRVFIAQEIDMTGAKKLAGEWSDKDASERGIKIVGDVVQEWVKRTFEIYGEPRKTIVFCAGVAHGMELSKAFKTAGYNFVSVSYKDTDEFKQEMIQEFKKPVGECSINGLIATDLLTEGFDVPDVEFGIMARPFSKSFSSFTQQLGRLMRSFKGKEFAVLNDHSGNYLRFKDQWDELYTDGVMELDDGAEKTKAEPTKDQKEAAKCPVCSALWDHPGDTCNHCGHTRIRRNEVKTVPGEMVEIEGEATKKEKYTSEYKEAFYQQLLGYCRRHGKADGYAWYMYQDKFKVKPPWAKVAVEPGAEVLNFIRSRNIARAKGMRK
jgi:superfamily II DNA or RNA helicase